MAAEQIVTEYILKLDSLKAQLNEIEKGFADVAKKGKDSQEAIDKAVKKTADTTKKASDDIVSNAQKREAELKKEISLLADLEAKSKKAFNADSIRAYNDDIKKSKENIALLKGEIDNTSKSGSNFAANLKGIGAAVGIAFSVGAVVNFAKEAVELAAKAEGVEKAFKKLDRPDFLDELRTATKGTLSDLELMSQAVKADKLGIPIEKIGIFFQFASQRARETGESVEFLVDSIVNGVGRQSAKVIDNLGISQVRVREEFGKTTDKMQAITNIIQGELNKQGTSIDTTADKLARFSAGFDNLKKSAGKALISFGGIVVDLFSSLGPAFDSNNNLTFFTKEQNAEIDKALGLQKKVETKSKEVVVQNKKEADSIENLRQKIDNKNKDLEKEIVNSESSKKVLKEIYDLEQRLKAALGEETDAQKASKKAIEERNNAQKASKKAIEERNKELKKEREELIKTAAEEAKANNKALNDKESGTLSQDIKDAKTLRDVKFELEEDRAKARQKAEEEGTKADEREINIAKDKKDRIKEIAIQGAQETSDAIFEITKANRDAETESQLSAIDQRRQSAFNDLDIQTQKLLSNKSLTEQQRSKIEADAAAKKKVIDDKFKAEEKKVKTDAFNAGRTAAILQATINTALAIVSALTAPPPAGQALAIAAGIAGAAQIAVIAAQPTPKFEKGTPYLYRGNNPQGTDTIPVLANEGEAIIPTNKNKERPGLAKAWIMGNLDEYINQNNVMPALREYVAKAKEAEQGNMANAMAASIILHNKMNAGPDEYAIGRQMKKSISGNSINIANADAIASSLAKQLNKTNNFF